MKNKLIYVFSNFYFFQKHRKNHIKKYKINKIVKPFLRNNKTQILRINYIKKKYTY